MLSASDPRAVFKRLLYLTSFELLLLLFITLFRKSSENNAVIGGYSIPWFTLLIFITLFTGVFTTLSILAYQESSLFRKITNQIEKIISLQRKPTATITVLRSVIVVSFALIFLQIYFPNVLRIFPYTVVKVIELLQYHLLFLILFCQQTIDYVKIKISDQQAKNEIESKADKFVLKRYMMITPYLLVVLVIAFTCIYRLTMYGTPRYSLATFDTPKFMESVQTKFPSIDFFTGDAFASIALFYKLLEPEDRYQIGEIQSPMTNSNNARVLQPGLDRITIGQTIFSLTAWSILAITVTLTFRNPILKIFAGSAVILFGNVPQIADWDNVLLSESLSTSFFVIVLALSLIWFRLIQNRAQNKDWRTIFVSFFYFISICIWIFTRDTNAYYLIGILLLMVFPLANKYFRDKLPIRIVIVMVMSLVLLFAFQFTTFKKSPRWVNPLINNLRLHVLPYESRVETFKEYGMPVTEDVLNLQHEANNTPTYKEIDELTAWVYDTGLTDYMNF